RLSLHIVRTPMIAHPMTMGQGDQCPGPCLRHHASKCRGARAGWVPSERVLASLFSEKLWCANCDSRLWCHWGTGLLGHERDRAPPGPRGSPTTHDDESGYDDARALPAALGQELIFGDRAQLDPAHR